MDFQTGRLRRRSAVRGWLLAGCLLARGSFVALAQETNSPPMATNPLSLKAFLQLVLERNESLQMRLLEFEINRLRFRAEQGVFEPELVLGYERVENERENTAEQQRSSSVRVFNEKNNLYNGGLEALVPTGARVRLGYTLRDLRNNIQDLNLPSPAPGTIVTNGFGPGRRREYQTFAGVSLTQPLLKNAWNPATMASIRLASLASEVAFQEYRRQMMVIVSTAEAAYWNLYLAQEQARFFQESVVLAEGIVRDTRAQVDAGKGSELDVMQAEAGLALRRSKQAEAEQKLREAAAQLRSLMSVAPEAEFAEPRATDQPQPVEAAPTFQEAGVEALQSNPDYLSQRHKLAQERVRLAYAKNQRLPQLDLKASYGLNGLGDSPGHSWDDVQNGDFVSFGVGLELRIPLTGGLKPRREVNAARLRTQQSLLGLKEAETQVLNAVKTALDKVRNSRRSVENYQAVVGFNQNLLETQLARLEVGKVESRKVLEVDADLFEAKNAVVEALVQYERALLELSLVQGALLRARNLDWTQQELQRRTRETFRRVNGSEERFNEFLQDVKSRYHSSKAAASATTPMP